MKNKIFITVIFMVLLSYKSTCQTYDFIQHQSTQYPSGGKYEIVSSSITRANTFKINKYTGEVFQFVVFDVEKNECGWQSMYIGKHPQSITELNSYNAPVYQLFLSGRTNKDIFLLDTKTGFTWNLVEDTASLENWFLPLVTAEFYSEEKDN